MRSSKDKGIRSGCSAVRLARQLRELEVAGSNPVSPTIFQERSVVSGSGSFFISGSLRLSRGKKKERDSRPKRGGERPNKGEKEKMPEVTGREPQRQVNKGGGREKRRTERKRGRAQKETGTNRDGKRTGVSRRRTAGKGDPKKGRTQKETGRTATASEQGCQGEEPQEKEISKKGRPPEKREKTEKGERKSPEKNGMIRSKKIRACV